VVKRGLLRGFPSNSLLTSRGGKRRILEGRPLKLPFSTSPGGEKRVVEGLPLKLPSHQPWW
jgi:hypothetical protein